MGGIIMKNAIEIKNVTKEYAHFKLDNLSLDIPAGVIVGLIGENGAGKTTLIKSILNIIHTSQGTIKRFSSKMEEEDLDVKQDIGVVLDNMFFPEILTPKDINSIMKDVYKNWDTNLFYEYLKKFGINDTQKLKTMSKGMRKKTEIATSLSHKPKLLILDEPTSGLDPVVRNEVLDIFQSFVCDEEHTILFSTHITSDLEHIADNIVFIDKGKLLMNQTRDEILDRYGILKCDISSFDKIDKKDMLRHIKHKYNYEILVDDKEKMCNKYKDFVVDKITLEDLMILMIKGEE